jgi:uncharacterized membrane protein YdjX (TVP38/TMEM64 family)
MPASSYRYLFSGMVVGALFALATYATVAYEEYFYSLVMLQGFWGMFAYVVLAVLATVVAPFSTLPLIPIASHLWGWFATALLSILGWVIGSQIAFWIARHWGKPFLQKFLALERIDYFEHYFERERLFWSVVFLRMTVPVDILSYAIGLFSRMSATQFFLSTLIGVAPFAFVFAYVGTLPVYIQLFVLIEVGALLLTLYLIKNPRDVLRSLVAIGLLTVAVCVWLYRDFILGLVDTIEAVTAGNSVLIALILIVLKSVSAPVGFPGTPLTLLSGSLLGPWWGTLTALIGNTIGAILAFITSRFILRDSVQENVHQKYPRIHEFESRLESKPFATVVFLRLVPLFPFNALNFLLGLTHIPLRTYALASFIGMIPGTFMFVYFGDSIATLSPVNIGLSIVGLIALILIGKRYGK